MKAGSRSKPAACVFISQKSSFGVFVPELPFVS